MHSVTIGNAKAAIQYAVSALPPNLVKSRGREIACYNSCIALKFDRHLDRAAAEVPVKFKSNWENLSLNLVASRINE